MKNMKTFPFTFIYVNLFSLGVVFLIIEASAQWESTNTGDNKSKTRKESNSTCWHSTTGHVLDESIEAISLWWTIFNTS